MKRIFVIFAILASASSGFAQNACSNNDPFFNFNNGAGAREIHSLGTNPEFPFIRNLSTPRQVYAAIKKNENMENYKSRMDQLNNLLISIGFANGIQDLQASNITADNIPSGSQGNMGSSDNNEGGYYKLTGDPSGYKAWKISSPSGCYVYLLARCGNAFYPNPNSGRTACITTPVSVTSDPKEITTGTTPPVVVSDKTYVYYHMRHKKSDKSYVAPGITDDNPSQPLLLSSKKRAEATPQTYKITVSGPADNVTVCPDSTTDVAANINVESESSYTGNYPDDAKATYTEVSRREYDRAERKMHKVEKKEAKVSRITDVHVDIEAAKDGSQ